MSDSALADLARAAGILVRWTDAFGKRHIVSPATLRSVLAALDLPAATAQQIRDSRASLGEADTAGTLPPLVIASVGQPVTLPALRLHAAHYRILCDDGAAIEGSVTTAADGRPVLPPLDRWGYHRLQLDSETTTLAVAPSRCFGIADVAGRTRIWGLAAQLYALRRQGDGGLGDYRALALLAERAGRLGADALAVSPVHAMFSSDPARHSPYAPSNRLFLNVLHIDVADVCAQAGVRIDEPTARQLQHWEQLPLIDWPAMAATRLTLLRQAFDAMVQRGLLAADTPDGRALAEFRRDRGAALERHACFEALHAQMLRADKGRWHWRSWPAGFRAPHGSDVAAFARDFAHEVAFHAFLQWRAAAALAAAQAAAVDAGMRFGLIADLAVGTDPGGSQAWGHQSEVLPGLSVGAPPDLLNPLGQGWGLATFSPRALKRTGYAPFTALLHAVMRHAGGVRIDHVLGLQRLWLVPEGGTPRDGAYLSYPIEDLSRLIALESWRHRTLVIGEDLGTVPPGFRTKLRKAGMLGTRVLWFERADGGFAPPAAWPANAAATSATHDVPTVCGWWAGRDIDWRVRLGILGQGETAASLQAGRAADRTALWRTLCEAAVAKGDPPAPDDPVPVLNAVAAFVGATPCTLALLPLEDVLGLDEQPNLPGTTEGHPNWQRRLPSSVDTLLDEPAARARIAALRCRRRAV